MIQTSKEYKKIAENMKLYISGLLITAFEEPKKKKKIEQFLTKDTEIVAPAVFEKLIYFTQKTTPQTYVNYFYLVSKKIIINSYSIEILEEKESELLNFSKSIILKSQSALRELCKLNS